MGMKRLQHSVHQHADIADFLPRGIWASRSTRTHVRLRAIMSQVAMSRGTCRYWLTINRISAEYLRSVLVRLPAVEQKLHILQIFFGPLHMRDAHARSEVRENLCNFCNICRTRGYAGY